MSRLTSPCYPSAGRFPQYQVNPFSNGMKWIHWGSGPFPVWKVLLLAGETMFHVLYICIRDKTCRWLYWCTRVMGHIAVSYIFVIFSIFHLIYLFKFSLIYFNIYKFMSMFLEFCVQIFIYKCIIFTTGDMKSTYPIRYLLNRGVLTWEAAYEFAIGYHYRGGPGQAVPTVLSMAIRSTLTRVTVEG